MTSTEAGEAIQEGLLVSDELIKQEDAVCTAEMSGEAVCILVRTPSACRS